MCHTPKYLLHLLGSHPLTCVGLLWPPAVTAVLSHCAHLWTLRSCAKAVEPELVQGLIQKLQDPRGNRDSLPLSLSLRLNLRSSTYDQVWPRSPAVHTSALQPFCLCLLLPGSSPSPPTVPHLAPQASEWSLSFLPLDFRPQSTFLAAISLPLASSFLVPRGRGNFPSGS